LTTSRCPRRATGSSERAAPRPKSADPRDRIQKSGVRIQEQLQARPPASFPDRIPNSALTWDTVSLDKKKRIGYVSSLRRAGVRAMLNYELWIVSCLLTCGHRRLPTAFEGSASWRDSWAVRQNTTRCRRRQEKKKPVTLKSEGTTRECL
jgi:hypothetical protein